MTALYRMEELSDVFVDACLRDGAGRLLFLSCYGCDTSIQQLLSAFHLPAAQGGLDSFHLVGADGQRHPVEVGEADRLDKLTGRLPRDNLFGNLAHAWVYDPRLRKADYANRVAWLVDRRDVLAGGELEQRIWGLYKQLSPVPLLDPWMRPLMTVTHEETVFALDDRSEFTPLGQVLAYRVQLQDDFLETVSRLVKSGVLALS